MFNKLALLSISILLFQGYTWLVTLSPVLRPFVSLLDVIRRCKAKQMAKPWITKGLLTSIRKKNKLYHNGLWDEYKLYRNKLSLLTRLSKRNYYNSFFELNRNNMKATWEGINNLTSSSKKKVNQISIIKNPMVVSQLTLVKFQMCLISILLVLDSLI